MSSEYEELWADLDARLRSVVSGLGERLESREFVIELLDHNEFGAAFEWLRDTLIETQTPVSAGTAAELTDLARLMDLDARAPELPRDIANPP